ncbi:MAG: MerR family transcriptional regulator [Lapillicoccus sp.]
MTGATMSTSSQSDGTDETERALTALTVGQVADDLGVTVRTLHHYDEIGLVRPSERSRAGYRLYTGADLERLQHVVVYRRLSFSLEEIAELLEATGTDLEAHLLRQRATVIDRLSDLHDLVDAIDRALEKERMGMPLTPQEQKELFGGEFAEHQEEYAVEAQERWGDTDAWKQSADRTATYTKADWEAIKVDMDAVNAAAVAALQSGAPATSEAAMDAAERARQHIERWFYDTSPQFHRNLGDMYVSDPRFTKTYEDLAPGLAAYLRDAIHANADRQQGER